MCDERDPRRKIDVDFGETETGAMAARTVEIVNGSCVEQTYVARRDIATSPLDHVFQLCSYSWTLSPGQVHKCKIYYRPFVPSSVNVDHFTIQDAAGEHAEIRVHGTCVGPVISSSTRRVVMACTSENCETKKRIKLLNESSAKAIFMFDVDLVQSPFKVDPEYGHIGPRSRRYVTITFVPRGVGIYAQSLPCLILDHKPIIIDLYGYCGSVLCKADLQNYFNYPARLKNGFEGYTSDTVVTVQDLPVVSLSKSYIDFTQADGVATESAAQNIPQTLCVTNHSQSDVSIKWDQDVEGDFNVTPAGARIAASRTALFEVVFNPGRENNLYARELVGYVSRQQREDEGVLAFPTITSVRLIGHSFPASRPDHCIPQYEMPQVVNMPPCVPSLLTYATFVIRKFNGSPLMYRFVSPASSRFIVKPMMGIINQDYQIVVVGMFPGTDNGCIYEERWTIRFNGNTSSECLINFRGLTECASVSFNGQGDVINVTPTFPGCRQTQILRMRNVTRHLIRYEFVNVPPELQFQTASDEIYANDIVMHEWEFCPSIIGNYELDLNCILIVMKDGDPIGSSSSVTLHLIGKCELGFLTSTPDELNFGVLAYKARKALSFRASNSSAVNIPYKITCCHSNWPIGNAGASVKIDPISDTVLAGKDKTVTVSVRFSAPEYYELVVQYFVRVSPHTDALVADQMPRPICKLHCLCVLPTLKVMDLQCYGPCPEMSKVFLWKLMGINTLNTLFRELLPGTSKSLYINFPAMVLCSSPAVIKLLVTSASAVIASWNVKRVQLCSCRPVVKTKGLSFTRARYDCLHRKVSSVQPRSGNLKAGEEKWITLELHYVLLGKTEAKWDLDLGDNRHIFLILTIEGLSEFDKKLCLLSGLAHFKFQHVYLGDKSAVYQVCWVHNATSNSVPFFVNAETMREINRKYCYDVFSCASTRAIVKPLSSLPILLKFQPRQFGVFKGKLHLTLGDEERELTLEGESSLPHKATVVGEYVPSDCRSRDDGVAVHFNTDRIDIPCISMHSRAVRMIMVHNSSVQDVFAYEWKRLEIPGTIQVDIHPRKGVIKPMSVRSFRATIHTKEYPCVIDVNVPCEFLNACERRAYQRSVYKYEDLSRELEHQFTITEKGISVPKPWLKVLEKPQPFYKAITIRCFIYHPEDKCLKVSLKQELTSAPPKQIYFEQNEKCTVTLTKEDIRRSSFIIEGLLWEIVNSKLFKHLTRDVLESKSNLFYSQFKMNLHERKRLIRRSYISPPRSLINRILEKMLFIMLHEEFGLKIVHLIERTDIRHKTYLNKLSGINRIKTVKQERRMQIEEDTVYPEVAEISPKRNISFA